MKLYVALEVDFILALVMGEDFCLAAIDTITSRRGFPLVTPCVLQELKLEAKENPDEALRGVAQKAINQLSTLNILTPSMDNTQRDLAEILAKKLVNAGIFDCYQSALAIAEAAHLNCRVMLTYKLNINGTDLSPLKLHLVEHDVIDCTPLPPPIFVDFFHKEPAT